MLGLSRISGFDIVVCQSQTHACWCFSNPYHPIKGLETFLILPLYLSESGVLFTKYAYLENQGRELIWAFTEYIHSSESHGTQASFQRTGFNTNLFFNM